MPRWRARLGQAAPALVVVMALAALAMLLRPLGGDQSPSALWSLRLALVGLSLAVPGAVLSCLACLLIAVIVVAAAWSPVPALALDGAAGELTLVAAWSLAVAAGRSSRHGSVVLLWAGLVVGGLVVLGELVEGAPPPAHWLDPSQAGLSRLGGGLFVNPNILGALGALLAFGFADRRGSDSGRRGPAWLCQALPAALATAVVAVTLSRSAWLGWMAGALTWVVLRRHELRWPHLLALLAAGCLLVAPARGVRARLASATDPDAGTVQHRLYMWQSSWRIARDHPWVGVGPSVGPAAFAAYRAPGRPEEWALLSDVGSLHNDYLQGVAEHGFGLTALVLLLLGIQVLRRRPGPPRAFTWPALAAVATTSCFQGNLAQPAWCVYAVTLLGLLYGEAEPGVAEVPHSRREPLLQTGARLTLAAVVLLAAWQLRAAAAVSRGEAALARADTQAALLAANRGRRWAPWLSTASALRGWACLAEAQADTARAAALLPRSAADFERARRWNPYDATYCADLAEVARLGGAPPGAIAAWWRRAVRLDPYRASYRARLAELLLLTGPPAEARAELREALDLYRRQLAILGRRGAGDGAVARRARADQAEVARLCSSAPPLRVWVELDLTRDPEPCWEAFLAAARATPPGQVTLLVKAQDLDRQRDRVVSLVSSSGLPVVVVVPWQRLLVDPTVAARCQASGARVAIGADAAAAREVPQWPTRAPAHSVVCWQTPVVPSRRDAVDRFGFTDQLAASHLLSAGLVPAPFTLASDWPRLRAYLGQPAPASAP